MTAKQAVALAGDWYNWFIARYEDDPGDPATIEHAVRDIIEAMREFAPDEGGHADSGLPGIDRP